MPSSRADPGPVGGGTTETCKPETATPDGHDEQEEHLGLLLIQSEMSISGQGAPLRTGAGRTLGGRLGTGSQRSLVLIIVLISPFAVLQLLLTWPAAARLVLARRTAQAGGMLGRLSNSSSLKSKNAQGLDFPCPWVVLLFFHIGNFIMKVDFTIMMPGSATIMLNAGGSMVLSGLAIGSYGLGSMASLPFVIYLSRRSFKHTLLLMVVVAVLGNAAYAVSGLGHGNWAVTGLILSRVLSGVEGGAIVMMNAGIVHLSSGMYTTTAIAMLNLWGCVGLVSGPALSSLSQICLPGVPKGIPPSALMITFAVAYGACVLVWFPSQRECFAMAGVPDPDLPEATQNKESRPPVKMRASWLFMALMCVQYMVRGFQKVSWEAGALLIIEKQYGISQMAAGFVICVPLLCTLPVLALAGQLHKLGPAWACTVLGLLELLGMLMMFQVGQLRSGVEHLALLGIGSIIFYGANWVSVVPMAPLWAKFSVRGHWALNVEAMQAASWATACAGNFYGPIVSRAILGANPIQNLLAASLVMGWIGGFLAVELGMHVLMDGDESACGKEPACGKEGRQ